jgi:hypothetical protein
MVWFHQWCTVAFTELVTVLPNDLHDTNKMRIATGAYWPVLADADLHVQRSLQIDEYTDPIATRRCRTRSSGPRLVIDKMYVDYWFRGRPSPEQLWAHCRTCCGAPRRTST